MPLLASRPVLRVVLAAAALAAALAFAFMPAAHPGVARANDQQISIMQDDDLLVYRDDATRDAAMHRMKGLGVDAVRVTVLWSVVANGAQATPALRKRFHKLGADNPKAYPAKNWDRYDRLARACKTLGIQCYFDLTGPGPAWAHKKPPAKYAKYAKTWMPKPSEFYKFVAAVGKRYSGRYRDENDGHQGIPPVRTWSLWNEPNQGGWLTPQYYNGKLYSPVMYRALYNYGYRALQRTGHAKDTILAGETAPLGVARQTVSSAVAPKTFIRQLFCAPGTDQTGCNLFDKRGPMQMTAWAHHPYTKNLPPTQPSPNPDDITMANIADLPNLLDEMAAQTGHVPAGLDAISSEFGYETNPPDPFAKTSLQQQAEYLEMGDFLAYVQPRIIGQTQFLLRDVKPNHHYRANSKPYWGTYQSGLFTAKDVAKPAAAAYALPFLAQNQRDAAGNPAVDPATGLHPLTIWGQLRFLPNTFSADQPNYVQIEWKPTGGDAYLPVGPPQPVTNRMGFFFTTIGVPGPGVVRASYPSFGVTSLDSQVG